MKQYRKTIDGQPTIMSSKRIIIIKDGMQIINPAEEMILSDGWEEYIAPEPQKIVDLATIKRNKKFELETYDSSDNVNEFVISNRAVWLDKATRAGLLLRFQAEQAQGVTDTTLWHEGRQFPLKVDQAIQMLYAIELYASACYDNTQRHLAAIQTLHTIEEVDNYDYKAGYPEKLRF